MQSIILGWSTSSAGFQGIIRDTRGAYKSRVMDGKCYIINATHILVYTFYFILQAEIEADTHVSIILLMC